jgi:hypothetical protein
LAFFIFQDLAFLIFLDLATLFVAYLSARNTEKYGPSTILAGLDVVEKSQTRFCGILGLDEEQFVLLNL